jgi:alginate O-acetyltransferase complex protein AlgI
LLFNSGIFLLFLISVLTLYWFVLKKWRLQVLLLSGCIFYGSWDWRFLLLLFFTSGVDFVAAKKIVQRENSHEKKFWLVLSVTINLIILGFFKYYNFFAASFTELAETFGARLSYTTLHIILPLGVSFYTFQSIAYVTDVFRRKIMPEQSALVYFSFICFFPQMVAGPIERAKRMLPQFRSVKVFKAHYFESGINLLFYGFFKKVVIADNLALFVDHVHSSVDLQGSAILVSGIFAFAIQIYADFSGYTDIARGCAQLLGFRLSHNFHFPYFSSSLRVFWKRWHISLSTWFRDYLYIPLGGNRVRPLRRKINLIITFLISGLWHGANLTFIFWGFLHGFFLSIEKQIRPLGALKFYRGFLVFIIVSFLFTLFRSPNIRHYCYYLQRLLTSDIPSDWQNLRIFESGAWFIIPLVLFVSLELIKYNRKSIAAFRFNYLLNCVLFLSFILFAVFENAPRFIYFQF